MTTPISRPDPVDLGPFVKEFPGSGLRLIWPVFLGALAIIGFIASIVQGSLAGLLFWGALGAACYGYYYYFQRDVSARVYERGFVITRGVNTITARWEQITNIQRWVKTTRLYFIIPISRSHYYVVTLNSGQRIKINHWFQKEMELGALIQQMYARHVVAERSTGAQ